MSMETEILRELSELNKGFGKLSEAFQEFKKSSDKRDNQFMDILRKVDSTCTDCPKNLAGVQVVAQNTYETMNATKDNYLKSWMLKVGIVFTVVNTLFIFHSQIAEFIKKII
jgi:hypothetical protein